MISERPRTIRLFIAVKTYPVPAKKGVEVSCTAGITPEGEWIRLFPVPFRLLGKQQQFKRYQWIEVSAVKAHDGRIESWKPHWDSIHVASPVVSTTGNWRLRKEILFPLRAISLCELKRKRDSTGSPTLGLFRPRNIRSLKITPEDANWSPDQLARLRQPDMFLRAPPSELEKIPYRFAYEFDCNDATCTGHDLMCTDWEMSQSYRRWRSEYGANWPQKFRTRYETEMTERNDTHLMVGTTHEHPNIWIIVGLFYPRRSHLPLLDGLLGLE